MRRRLALVAACVAAAWRVLALVSVGQRSYGQRLRTLLKRDDVRMVFAGRLRIEEAMHLLSDETAEVAPERREWAQKVVSATTHPSGYIVPGPLRPAAYAYVNIPLVLGTMLCAGSTARLVCLQLVNQVFNASFNIANGASGVLGIRKRYVLRDMVAALSLSYVVVLASHSVQTALSWEGVFASLVVAYLSVASAGCVNLFCSRRSEIFDGVDVADETGNYLATSRAAGRATFLRALLSRTLLLPLVAISVPSALMALVGTIFPGLLQSQLAGLFLQVFFIAITLAFGLPACIALFPDTLVIPVNRLEMSAQLKARGANADLEDVYVFRGV